MKKSSPYSAAFTGCGFMLQETFNLLPILTSNDADALLRKEIVSNERLRLGKEKTRLRNVLEIKKRYAAVPVSYWLWFENIDDESKPAALFYVLLKTYKLLFDFQINVVVPHWNSASQMLSKSDLMMRLNEIAANDTFVEGWSDTTKSKICARAIAFIRTAGLMDQKSNALHPVALRHDVAARFISTGEAWFLEACLIPQYEIARIKEAMQ